MSRHKTRELQIGDWWLSQRKDSECWYACTYDKRAKRSRRISLGTGDVSVAKEALLKIYLKETKPQNEPLELVTMAQVLMDYYEGHAKFIRSGPEAKGYCRYWNNFFGEMTVAEATNARTLEAFIQSLADMGHSTAYQQRIVGTGKAALNRAYKRGVIDRLPYVPSVKVKYGSPQGRPLKEKEVALLLTHAPDHIRLLLYIMIGTACRPEAAYELTGEQLDFENRLIDLNPPGREQTKKIRPVVKMPESLAIILKGAPKSRLITFRGKPVKNARNSWRALRSKCNLDDRVQPYSIRHTMARWMRKEGISAWDTAAQLGHKSRDHRITELYAPLDPDYLETPALALESFFQAIRANLAPEITPHFRVETAQTSDRFIENGAGEAIRTPDPNLGKVRITYH